MTIRPTFDQFAKGYNVIFFYSNAKRTFYLLDFKVLVLMTYGFCYSFASKKFISSLDLKTWLKTFNSSIL